MPCPYNIIFSRDKALPCPLFRLHLRERINAAVGLVNFDEILVESALWRPKIQFKGRTS